MRKLLVLLTVVLATLVAAPGVGQADPLEELDAANVYLVNAYSGKCLDLENWGQGRYVQQYPCHWGDNQLWQLVEDPNSNGVFEIKPNQYLGVNECLDVEHNGAGPYTQRYPCHLGGNQRWRAWDGTGNTFKLSPLSDLTKCLDASDFGRGVRVQIYPCHNGSNQRWSRA